MKQLILIDVSQYLSAGALSEYKLSRGVYQSGGKFLPKAMPAGGLRYLLTTYYTIIKNIDPLTQYDIVYCFDDRPQVKQDMANSYKKGLVYKGDRRRSVIQLDVWKQSIIAYDALKALGFNCIRVNGFEADDIIYSIHQQYSALYDKTLIYTEDSMLYTLIDDTTFSYPVHNKGKYVCVDNFKAVVSTTTMPVEYNTIVLEKTAKGINNIPAVSAFSKYKSKIPPKYYSQLGDLNQLRYLIEGLSDDIESDLLKFNIMVPMSISLIDLFEPFNQFLINEELVDILMYKLNYTLVQNRVIYEQEVEELIDELIIKYISL